MTMVGFCFRFPYRNYRVIIDNIQFAGHRKSNIADRVNGRCFTSTNTNNVSTSFLRRHWDNGNVLIAFGWSLFVVLLIDRYLQKSEKKQIHDAIAMLHYQMQRQRDQLSEKYQAEPAIRTARVIKVYHMSGSHSLMHVHENDVIEVLQENVGPSHAYHLCRLRDPTTGDIVSIGWYPSSHLETLSPSSTKKSLSWRWWW
jgi:hypothetical protein